MATVLMIAPVGLAVCKKLKINPVGMLLAIAVSSNLQGAATLVGDTTSIMLGAYAGMQYEIDTDVTNALCDAACITANDIKARAIVTLTTTGKSARRMSKFRPLQPIVAATPLEKTYHQLALSWGVYPVLSLRQDTLERLLLHAVDCAKALDLVTAGDLIVIAAGVPVLTPGNTNLLKVEVVKGAE